MLTQVMIATKTFHSIPKVSLKNMLLFQPRLFFSILASAYNLLTQFYEDFLEEITQSDPELDKYGLVKSLHKKSEERVPSPSNNYRK